MKEEEVPDSTRVRELVMSETVQLRAACLQALSPGQPNRFSWNEGVELWVDRVRRLVLSKAIAEMYEAYDADTVPEHRAGDLEFDGVRKSIRPPLAIAELWGARINGIGVQRHDAELWAEFANYAAIQPTINPAFESLVWLGLEVELRTNQSSRNLGKIVGAMAYDMARYPDSLDEAAEVRAAQIAFVRKYWQPVDDSMADASDDVWAARCRQIIEADGAWSVFQEIAAQARRQIIAHERG